MQEEEGQRHVQRLPGEGWRLTGNPLEERDLMVTSQQPSGVVRVTEILRRLNSGEAGGARRGSDSEEERTSRRSSGGDSGLGNLSESELLEQEHQERTQSGQWSV